METDSIVRRFTEAQSRLVTQASDFSLETIAQMVDSNAIDPSPGYQRRQRWDATKQSALIESFLLNVPVPPVYLAEEEFGVYSVIDGKQRITAIHQFMRGNLVLRGLAELTNLIGARIRDLPEAMSNALRMRPYIRAVTLLKQSDPELKYEVFLRLNRGGETLTAQEVRNVAFRGPFNDLLIRLGEDPFLRAQFNIDETSERYKQMLDAEFVLRFLTLSYDLPSFSGDLAPAMDAFMLRSAQASKEQLASFESRFSQAIHACYEIWGEYSFRRAERGIWRGRALLGMFDAEMLAVDSLPSDAIARATNASEGIIQATADLFNDEEFYRSVTASTNTSTRLRYRVDRVRRVLSAI